MKGFVISTMLVFLPIITAAEELGGIDDSNYKASISGNDSEAGNRLSLRGEARFPVTNYTGISLSASLSEFYGDNNYLDSSDKSIGLGVFLRKYDLGIVSARYIHTESEADIPSGTLKNDFDIYSLSGTYYIDMFDISLNRSTGNSNTGSSFDATGISAAYYVNDNFRVSASAGGMDDDESYSLSATYQPKVFNNSISVLASYQDTNTNDSYDITISYYFDTKVSLIDRIRRY
jgi:hypothetical protein